MPPGGFALTFAQMPQGDVVMGLALALPVAGYGGKQAIFGKKTGVVVKRGPYHNPANTTLQPFLELRSRGQA
jgi:hypothetical protein